MYESRAKDDKDILEILRDEYNMLGVIKRTTQSKKGSYDGQSERSYEERAGHDPDRKYRAEALSSRNVIFDGEMEPVIKARAAWPSTSRCW